MWTIGYGQACREKTEVECLTIRVVLIGGLFFHTFHTFFAQFLYLPDIRYFPNKGEI